MTDNSIWLELKGTTSQHRSILPKHRLKCGFKIEELSGENRKWIVRARVEQRSDVQTKKMIKKLQTANSTKRDSLGVLVGG